MHEENKMLLTNLESISDHTTSEFIRSEQERIIKKRTQEQQQPSNAPTFYGYILVILEVRDQVYRIISIIINIIVIFFL